MKEPLHGGYCLVMAQRLERWSVSVSNHWSGVSEGPGAGGGGPESGGTLSLQDVLGHHLFQEALGPAPSTPCSLPPLWDSFSVPGREGSCGLLSPICQEPEQCLALCKARSGVY